MLTISLTLDATIESFGPAEQVTFKARLATTLAAGIGPEDIKLVATAGSVMVTATIIVDGGLEAASQAAATPA